MDSCCQANLDLAEASKKELEALPPDVQATYCKLLDIRARLEGLLTHAEVSNAELVPLQEELDEVDAQRLAHQNVFAGDLRQGKIPPGQALLSEMLDACYDTVDTLRGQAMDMGPEVAAICKHLDGVRRALIRLRAARGHTLKELLPLQEQLAEIEQGRGDGGIFGGSLKEGKIPPGQARAADLLAQCYALVETLKDSAVEMSVEMQRIHDQLLKHRKHLRELRHVPHTSTDIRHTQGYLDKIDAERQAHGGVFCRDLPTGDIPAGQAACSSLLHECYRLVQLLYETAEDVKDEPTSQELAQQPQAQQPQAQQPQAEQPKAQEPQTSIKQQQQPHHPQQQARMQAAEE